MHRILGVCVLTLVTTIGCSKPDVAGEAKSGSATTAAANGHDHGGWWCGEHGVPEEVCALCSSKVAAKMKADGDWCAKHDRPQSQCFECKPELREKFAALYEAKFGEAPPKAN